MGTLYIVATPIGNLEDITLRAIRVLKEVDVILCEDTRQTIKLLVRNGITNKQLSTYNERQSSVALKKIFGWLEEGKNIALVTDAGTPGISDPGSRLVAGVREHFGDPPVGEVAVVPIPGPSAAITALSASGFPAPDYLFLGFLPHKKGRETLFKEIAASRRTAVFYESPHRILKTLESLKIHLSPERQMCVARELTKVHEELRFGTAAELAAHFAGHLETVRGEFVVVVSGA